MAKYWDKINLQTIGNIRLRARIASEVNEDHIGALVLQASLVEALLRVVITNQVGARRRTHKKYWDGDAKFSQLITYHELLGGKSALIKDLTKYNTTRNKIVHEALHYSSIKALIEEAEFCYQLGLILSTRLLRTAGFRVPRGFDKPLPFKRAWVD